ncbi:MAG: PQQ-dependent sugar dehydrogenase [Gemmatimonadota bacterium]
MFKSVVRRRPASAMVIAAVLALSCGGENPVEVADPNVPPPPPADSGSAGDSTPPQPAPVATVEITPDSGNLQQGTSLQLSATARDSAGSVLSDRPITWTSADPGIASVSDSGLVTGNAPGTTEIQATAEGVSGLANIVVEPPPVPSLQLVASGFDKPTHVTAPPGETARLFVVEQTGVIRLVKDGTLLSDPFLDISPLVTCCLDGKGMLSMVFHPGFAQNGRFWVYYVDLGLNTRIEEYAVSADPDVADPGSASEVLTLPQALEAHLGGQLVFGPDGFLYIALGDGGEDGDPAGNGQNLSTLQGSLLRIDVDQGAPFQIPANNPFVTTPGARPEIWAYGLRNPWRFSFDRATGDLFIGDVGENMWEEIDIQPAPSPGGENYGWNTAEGDHCFLDPACDLSPFTAPAFEYGHDIGCSVTGGFVYRGNALPLLDGTYFYADFCEGLVRSFRYNGTVFDHRSWEVEFGILNQIVSFGEDGDGELYILSRDGSLYMMVPAL